MSKARNLANLLADGAVGASELASTLDLSGKTLTLPEGVGGGVTTDSEANRPATPAVGTLFFNTTQDTLQQYTAQGWQDVGLEPFSISSVSGNIFTTTAGTLTISGTNFGASATVRFTVGISNYDVAVTPSSSTSITVPVASAVYGQSAGTSISVAVIQNNRVSNQINKTVLGLPTGGTITTDGGYRYHTFLSSGSLVIPSDVTISVETLIVAGGGGGGCSTYVPHRGAGGGGGGGYVTDTRSLSAGSYSVTVGLGGSGSTSNNDGTNGGNSSFSGSTTAIGGGKGGDHGASTQYFAGSGGSGGGGTNGRSGEAGTSGQGNAGGDGGPNVDDPYSGGGGGGAGGAGSPGTNNTGSNDPGGAGGPGLNWLSLGTFYAGGGGGNGSTGGAGGNGGGGNGSSLGSGATPGTQNRGGGGGGRQGSPSPNGGSGIVIVRYQL